MSLTQALKKKNITGDKKKKNREVLIIGCGGIGSYLIPLLDKTGLYKLTVFDPDIVELKNITYQNFEQNEIGENKAKTLRDRYFSIRDAQPYPILSQKQMEGYDLVVCCADNLDVRKTLYTTKNLAWLDLRAQGRNAAMISFQENPDIYNEKLAGPSGSFSCQGNDWDGSTSGQHFSHIVAGGMGAEWIHRFFAEDDNWKSKFIGI